MLGCGRACRNVGVVGIALAVAACAEAQLVVHTAKTVTKSAETATEQRANRAPAAELGGRYKVGNPYEVEGVWYHPKVDPNYDETGIASWYGKPFHGRATANGENYDMNELTAAHKTLPLPTMVRVTNLENGRSLILRINDRGPFVNGRVIDVSRRGAQLLGFYNRGTAKVRVEAVSGKSETFVADAGETSDAERAAVTAVPRAEVGVETLPPPDGVSQAPVLSRELSAQVALQPVSPSEMWVQAGAFAQRDNAMRLKARLDALGPTTISSVVVDGTRFFRVRIGPLGTVEDADVTLAQMIENGLIEARIIVD